MCHIRMKNKINHLRESCLRLMYNHKRSSFHELLQRNYSVSLYKWNLCFLVKEMFKIMKSIVQTLKELRNYILCIFSLWSLFCSVRVYIRLHFLPMILVKLVFRLSVFSFFVFLYLWLSIFSFTLCLNSMSFQRLNNIVLFCSHFF